MIYQTRFQRMAETLLRDPPPMNGSRYLHDMTPPAARRAIDANRSCEGCRRVFGTVQGLHTHKGRCQARRVD